MPRLVRSLLLLLSIASAACSDSVEDACSDEGASEPSGPKCCAGGCGKGTDGWTPRICKKGRWVCDRAVPEDACASPFNACSPMDFCGKVGIGATEADPAPELCCEGGSCNGTVAVHRVCKSGTQWECPAGAVPISQCTDYRNACGGILETYRASGFKLP